MKVTAVKLKHGFALLVVAVDKTSSNQTFAAVAIELARLVLNPANRIVTIVLVGKKRSCHRLNLDP